ncbi:MULTISPECIES: ComF family protein [Flavobacteriaceae]|uniref:ComF family protein n=1 Tax=Polaribacter marinaquae TaxID=1642819 RepID=A0ABZ2TV74_9FLAO
MKFLKDLLHLFYPEICANCQNQLLRNETILCLLCRHDLPLTNFDSYTDNKITNSFKGRVLIEKANALLFFRKKSITKNLIHELKYKNNEDIGLFFGNWLGEVLANNKEFSKIDCIVPVPIHAKRKRKRGYNQVTKFGETLSKHLNIPLVEGVLIRNLDTKTQTRKSRFERFNNLEAKFEITDNSILKNKHILIIDDVITTGATIEACAKELLKSTGIKISILAMAYTD